MFDDFFIYPNKSEYFYYIWHKITASIIHRILLELLVIYADKLKYKG